MAKPKEKSKDILLTGGSGAIGGAIAKRLAADGFRLHLTSRVPVRLNALVEEVSSTPAEAKTYALDLMDIKRCKHVVEEFFRNARHPFGLICNAGDHGLLGPYLDDSFDDWADSLKQNFLGHAAMIHAFAQGLKARGKPDGGAIVVLSGAGLGSAIGHANMSSYGTAKAAVTYLSESLSLEFRDLNITINAIAPGQVKSGITEQAVRAGPGRVGAYAASAQELWALCQAC